MFMSKYWITLFSFPIYSFSWTVSIVVLANIIHSRYQHSEIFEEAKSGKSGTKLHSNREKKPEALHLIPSYESKTGYTNNQIKLSDTIVMHIKYTFLFIHFIPWRYNFSSNRENTFSSQCIYGRCFAHVSKSM